tara:strand:+ start:1939 stop:2064 length:126 start_codon:yes stop_codon:yes gene_type:complete
VEYETLFRPLKSMLLKDGKLPDFKSIYRVEWEVIKPFKKIM